MDEKLVTIFVVDFSYGHVNIASVQAVEKAKTYSVNRSTQEDLFGNGYQYIGSRLPKGENVFTSARDAAQYATRRLAEYIDGEQKKINKARGQLQELYTLLGKP